MFSFKSVKTQLILYLALFALFLAIKDRDAGFLRALLICVAGAIAAEALILYLKDKRLKITGSAVITGLIVGYVLSSDAAWWKLIFAAALAILSKYVIRWRGKHIFNPAAFGVCAALILLGTATQWRGTYLWPILLPFGIYFTYKIKKLEVLAGYALASLALFAAPALAQKIPLWSIIGFYSYFYIFVMVIEPKITPVTKKGKYIFGAGTALLIFIFTESAVKFDAELFSLLAMNCTVPLLNKLP